MILSKVISHTGDVDFCLGGEDLIVTDTDIMVTDIMVTDPIGIDITTILITLNIDMSYAEHFGLCAL